MNIRNNPFALASLNKKPLLLDGAMGSLLQQRGAKRDKNLWMSKASLDNPDLVLEIHKEYIDAGADIITTNTFRTNPSAAKLSGINPEKLVKESVKISKEAAIDKDVLIAGSNAPAEDCYQSSRTISLKELEYNHHKHISLLLENKVDFILNETQSHLDEIKIICEFCTKYDFPFIVSLFSVDGDKLLDQNELEDVFNFIISYKPDAIAVNCISPQVFNKIIGRNLTRYNWGVYMNLGKGNYSDELISDVYTPDIYADFIKEVLEKNPSFVGACCGSTPAHIKKLRSLIDE